MKTCGQCSINYPDAVEFCPQDGMKLPGPPETQALYDPLIGSTIDGRYTVEALLGQGGMGFVYAARHAIIDKRVAIKVLRADSGDESAAQRFLVEAKAASKIGHQNIVDITDFGVLPDGQAYFVMEFLDGLTLGKLVHQSTQLEPLRTIGIVVQICRGLAAAHEKRIVHRDLKPENVFVLDRDGQKDMVKIVDFGIAKDQTYKKKLTQAGMVLGTPEYMSPEQATGQPTDHRVDVYALGCIMYEMLTGEVPFRADTPTKTLTMHVFEKAAMPPSVRRPELNIPPSLEKIVMRAMEKKPADRYADLREMMVALEHVRKELGGSRSGLQPSVPMRSPSTAALAAAVRRPARMRMLALIGGAALLVVGGVGFAVMRSSTPALKPIAPPVVVPVAQTPSPMPPGTTPPAPTMNVELSITSTPAGADVFLGPERLGVSPLKLKRPRGVTPITLTLRHAGYREESLEVIPNNNKELFPTLEPRREHVATSGHHSSHRSSVSGAAAQPPTPTPSPPTRRVSDLRDPFAQ